VGLLGANGAGKSTTLRALAGLIRPRSGVIRFEDKVITGLSPEQRVRAGIALVPEGRELFKSLSVQENLRVGAFLNRSHYQAACDEVLEYFPVLRAKREARAASLSGGEGQMLAIGRALMSRPRVLLLDEPSNGLAPLVVEQIFAVIRRIAQERQVSIVLVEQSAGQALSATSYSYVLENGQIALEGASAIVRQDARVQQLYLGG
jgi:branched-chain amino acid transport system ATP-binding protein